MFLIYIIFIFFAIGGIAAFLAFSLSPVLFWLQNGYWSLVNPPKMILLGTCFLAIHGAIGFGGLLYLRKTATDEGVDIANTPEELPWLSKSYWCKPIIQSKRNLSLDLATFTSRYFATISVFPLFAISESIKLIDYTAMIGLIFPLLALYFYLRLKKMRLHKYRYNPVALTLNPYPAFIGKKCQGYIKLDDIEQAIESSSIKLQCVLHKQAGDDYQQEKLWLDKTELNWSSSQKTLIGDFSFDLKQGLKEAQAAEEYPFISWEIHLHVMLKDGVKINKEYNNIPVFNLRSS